MKAIKDYFRYVNGWNWVAVLLAVQAFIGGYRSGLWDAFQGLILVTALVLLGRASLDRELEIALDQAKERIKNNKE